MNTELPWFPLYVENFLGSRRVQRMSAEQVGGYMLLLMDEWRNGPIQREDAAMLSRLPDADAMRLLSDCFTETDDGWVNDALEELREQQEAKSRRRSRAGKAGAKAKWSQGKNGNANAIAEQSDATAMALRVRGREEVDEKQILSSGLPEDSARDEQATNLREWLGKHAGCLEGVKDIDQRAIWGIWGPYGTNGHEWRDMPDEARPAIMATAILSWMASDDTRFYRPFLAKILARAINDAIAADRDAAEGEVESNRAAEMQEAAKQLEATERARLTREGAGMKRIAIPTEGEAA